MAKRVLIAGHSQVKYFDQYLKLSNVDVVSFSGYRIEQMWGVIGHRVPDYRIVVLHIGANNLWNDTPADVLTHYQSLVESILRLNPSCQILLSGLLPRGQDMFPGKMKSMSFLSLVNRKASYINNKLRNISKSIPRLTNVRHHSFVVDGKLQRLLLSKDGLHLTRDGATTVVRDLEAEIRRQLRPCTPVHFMRLPAILPYSLNYTQQATIKLQDQPPTPYSDALKTPTQYSQPPTHTKPLALDNIVDFPSLPSLEVSIWDPLVSPSRARVVSTVRARVISPSRGRVVSSVRARVVSPSRARVVSSVRARVVSAARARVVSPSRARVVSPSRARVVSPSRARVVSPSRARVVSTVRARVVPSSRARVVSQSATSQSSSHAVTSATSQSSSHVTSATSQSSSHVTSDTSQSSSHVTSATSQSSSHVTSDTSQSSSHVTSDTSQSSSHVTSATSQSSSHVTSATSQSSSHVTSDTSQSSSHVTSDTSQSSSHDTSDTSQSSSHVTSDTSQSSILVGGGPIVPYLTCIEELSKETIVSILSDPDMSKVTSLPPIKPKAGDIFVIESINTEDWKCDQYLWIRDGGRTIKIKGVEIGKVFTK
ncbi:PAFAH1B2_3 [Mytilus edulis]|uniref:PAFAH1B2_3 n=1 Tax=Mytilus edulis TaxID=6550 RepID=A0A8S3UJS5_MYTED|nr:PAFAH1B2_3 [Mytilus edulis]